MTKRTMIAHHCRRSGRKRKCLSSSFNRRKAGGELFLTTLLSLCFPSKGKLPHQQNKQHSPLQAVPYCLGGDSTSLPRCSCFLGPQCGILRFLPSHVQTDLISWFKSNQEEAESCCVLLPGDSPVHALHVLKHCPASRICLGELTTPLEEFLCFFWKRYEGILQNKTIPACTAVLHRLTPFCSYSEGFPHLDSSSPPTSWHQEPRCPWTQRKLRPHRRSHVTRAGPAFPHMSSVCSKL